MNLNKMPFNLILFCLMLFSAGYTQTYGTTDLQEIGFDTGAGFFNEFFRYWFIIIPALLLIALALLIKKIKQKLTNF